MLAEKQKWLDVTGATEALERAERAGRVREWVREIDEAIYFGHRADATLRRLAEELSGSITEKLTALDRLWAGGLSRAALRAEQESLIQLTSLGQHQIMLFDGELRDVSDRIDELATALQPAKREQLLAALKQFWMETDL